VLDVHNLIDADFAKSVAALCDCGFFENIKANRALTVFLQALVYANFE
jgi:hypothetical protein